VGLRKKFKRHIFNSYIKQVGGRENLDDSDYELLARAIEWRFGLLDKLCLIARSGDISSSSFAWHVRSLSAIQRQIETSLENYQRQINEISELANLGEIEQDDYEKRLAVLTTGILILSMLLGSTQNEDAFNPNQALLFDAANSILDAGLNGREISEVAKTIVEESMEILQDSAIIQGAFDDDEQAEKLNDELEIAQVAIPGLAISIYGSQYILGEIKPSVSGVEVDGPDRLAERLAMWGITALGLYAFGQLFRPDDPFYEWLRDVFKDGCTDCLRLDEQIHTAEEWRASGWHPQSSALECTGRRCGCIFVESQGPDRGSF